MRFPRAARRERSRAREVTKASHESKSRKQVTKATLRPGRKAGLISPTVVVRLHPQRPTLPESSNGQDMRL